MPNTLLLEQVEKLHVLGDEIREVVRRAKATIAAYNQAIQSGIPPDLNKPKIAASIAFLQAISDFADGLQVNAKADRATDIDTAANL
jgi:hypothetical protein